MKLYIYDHCPFCVRARMIFGLKNLPVENVVLPNDDEATPIGLIGKKAVPILVLDNGDAMPESLDIVRYVDGLDGQLVLTGAQREEIAAWLESIGDYQNRLVMPRFVKIGLPEFATQSAIDYFVHKKTDYIGSFEQNLADSPTHIERLNRDLSELDKLLADGKGCNGEWSLDDILLFPILRNLTIVRGVVFPERVLRYLNDVSAASGVDLYFDRAI